MSLSADVDLEEFVMAKDDLSGADIKAVCTEAGLLALRERRMRVTKADVTTAREKVSSSRRFGVSVSLSFAGAIQKERRYPRGTLLVDVWYCLSRAFSPRVYNLPWAARGH
jgi:SpoVK/Ycf46/Vps4 family AAA+-type ATPase